MDIVRATVRGGMVPVAIGLMAGLAGAIGATRMLKSLLFETRPADPGTLAAVTIILLCAAFAATLLPARRAARVDPMLALRHD